MYTYVGEPHLLLVIDTINSQMTLVDEGVEGGVTLSQHGRWREEGRGIKGRC